MGGRMNKSKVSECFHCGVSFASEGVTPQLAPDSAGEMHAVCLCSCGATANADGDVFHRTNCAGYRCQSRAMGLRAWGLA